jgi:hypothetical protein
VFGCLATASFVAVYPALSRFPLDNPIAWGAADWKAQIGPVAVLAVVAVAMLAVGEWTEVAQLLWIVLIVAQLRQAFAWHALLLLPWIVLRKPGASPLVDVPKLAAFLTLSLVAFRNPLVPAWLGLLP